MNEQISIWDYIPETELKPGDHVEEHGPVIPHIMRPSFIGRLVVVDKSTVSTKWYVVGRLEKYIEYEKHYRSIVRIGKNTLNYIDHYKRLPSIYHSEIYEVSPKEWDNDTRRWVPELRMKE